MSSKDWDLNAITHQIWIMGSHITTPRPGGPDRAEVIQDLNQIKLLLDMIFERLGNKNDTSQGNF